jgi:hypothetical protein
MKLINRIHILLVGIFGGQQLAINAAQVVQAPASVPATALGNNGQPVILPGAIVSVGLPADLDVERVRQRKIQLMNAGTEGLLAEKLAIDAETQQLQRDRGLAAEVSTKEVPVTTTVPEVTLKPDGSAGSLEDKTVDQLKELAASRKIEITSGMKKADIIAALA